MRNIILETTRKILLNEVAGISEIVRVWAKILKNEVEQQAEAHFEKHYESIKKEPETKTSIEDDPFYWEDEYSKGLGSQGKSKSKWSDEWYNYKKNYYKKNYSKSFSQGSYYSSYEPSYSSYTPIQEIVVEGKKYPEEYKKFSVDKWVFKNSSRIEYDHWHSGYDNEGNYIVYFNVPIMSLTEGAFIHEIKHAYDDWNRMSHGGKPIRDTWEIKNIYTPDFEKLVLGGSSKYPQLGPLIRYFYLGSKLETPAYLENEYDGAGINYLSTARYMRDFDTKRFFNKKGEPAQGLEQEFQEMKKLDIPIFKKYKNVTDFLNYVKKYFNTRGEDMFRRIVKMKAVHGKKIEPKMEPKFIFGEPKKPVSQQPKQEPQQKPKKQSYYDYDDDLMDEWKFSRERGWYRIGDED